MEVVFYDSEGNVVEGLTQWDINRKVIIRGLGLVEPPTVHFFNSKSTRALVVLPELVQGDGVSVNIPNILLQDGLPIIICIYIEKITNNTTEGKTIRAFRMPVAPKPMPQDYVYHEDIEYTSWVKLTEDAKKLIEEWSITIAEATQEALDAAAEAREAKPLTRKTTAVDFYDDGFDLTFIDPSTQIETTNNYIWLLDGNEIIGLKNTDTEEVIDLSGIFETGEDFDPVGRFDNAARTGEIFNNYTGQYKNIASASYSHAEGEHTTATGNGSHAEGNNTSATGHYSHAEGSSAKAIGNKSHAEGSYTEANGEASHAEGSGKARSKCSHAEGQGIAVGEFSHAEGTSETDANYAHAEGNATKAKGIASHAEGEGAWASGASAHAEGENTIASGAYSHAQNSYTIASFDYTTAIGKYNISKNMPFVIGAGEAYTGRENIFEVEWNGNLRIAGSLLSIDGTPIIGVGRFTNTEQTSEKYNDYTNNIAFSGFSHAEGSKTSAAGVASHSQNIGTVAPSDGSTAIGKYNDAGFKLSEDDFYSADKIYYIFNNTTGTYVPKSTVVGNLVNKTTDYEADTDIAFYIGNGTEDERSNALTVSWDGDLVVSGKIKDGFGNELGMLTGDEVGRFDNDDHNGEIFNNYDGENKNVASGEYSHAEGEETQATGEASHAEGYDTVASGDYSHAEGCGSESSGLDSHAEGYGCFATGESSHAEGEQTQADESYAHSEGYNTYAGGIASHAEGDATRAESNGGHAEGLETVAVSDGAHAEGFKTEAYGQYSHAQNVGTYAGSEASTAIGRWNDGDDNELAFMIGNGGDEDSRSNAFTVDWQGNVNIPEGANFYVGGEPVNAGVVTSYTHDQSMASAEWIVSHNLGKKYCNVFITDGDSGDETEIIGEITFVNVNLLVIRFNSPVKGKAYLN